MAQRKTKQPSGLTLARKNATFTAGWKCADKNYNGGQKFGWRTFQPKKTGWTWISVAAGARKASWTINARNYYPYTKVLLKSVQYGVIGNCGAYTEKGKRYNPTASDPSQKAFAIVPPAAPSCSNSGSDDFSNTWTYSWSYAVNATNGQMFTNVEWQTMYVENSTATDGSKLAWNSRQAGWQTGVGGASGSKTITEEFIVASTSYTRWFRARCRGPAGASAWTYTKHVYAKPNASKSVKASATKTTAGSYVITVSWIADQNAKNPISSTEIQYAIATPDAGLRCPAGASWDTVGTIKDTGGWDGFSFEAETGPGTDEALWVRVNTKYGTYTTYGAAVRVLTGALAAPSGLSAEINQGTRMATITCENESDVPDSFIAVYYCTEEKPGGYVCAVIPHGQESVTNVQLPAAESTDSFKARAVVGSSSEVTRADGVSSYTVTANAASSMISYGGQIPTAPANVMVSPTDIRGTVRVVWDWTWAAATAAEISWADHADAWESTDEPSDYVVKSINASKWNVSGLETGITWYFRVRLIQETSDSEVYGPYSEIIPIDLASAPAIPVLALSADVITRDGEVTASWVYSTGDGTAQAAAEVAVVTEEGSETIYTPVAQTASAQYVVLNAAALGWQTGGTYQLAVRVTSGSGRMSDGWSNTVSVTVAEPLNCAIAQTSLMQSDWQPVAASVTETTADEVSVDDDTLFAALEGQAEPTQLVISETNGVLTITLTTTEGTVDFSSSTLETLGITVTASADYTATITLTTRYDYTLTTMPLTVTATGAGAGGTTRLIIERAATYHVERPDERDLNGFEGETIAIMEQTGEAQMTVALNDLLGRLDDEASYRLIVTVQDGLGQSAQVTREFEVAWAHQAIVPEATVITDAENMITRMTPFAPEGWQAGDVCDIYRLSVDRPELIVEGAAFGTEYVDPYPALGEFGGHRFVYRTIYDDYITEDMRFAWIDTREDDGDRLDSDYALIDFPDGTVQLAYNIELSNDWEKDFRETKYLGGAVRGDWNVGVSRSASVTSAMVTLDDADQIELMRRLAVYPGICHVRTQDGSSYAADVQVSETYSQGTAHKIAEFSLTITRVDPEGFDGMTYADWEEGHRDEME